MLRLTELDRRRLRNFRANRRAFWSLWIFLGLFVLSLFAELIANDQPILVKFKGEYLSPVLTEYNESFYGGDEGRVGRPPFRRLFRVERGQVRDVLIRQDIGLRRHQHVVAVAVLEALQRLDQVAFVLSGQVGIGRINTLSIRAVTGHADF